MDGLITLIVLVIVFNLINRLIGAAKGKQQSQPRRSFRFERSNLERSTEKDHRQPSFFQVSSPGNIDDSHTGEEKDDAQEIEPLPGTVKKRAKSLAVEKKVKQKTAAGSASSNLRDLLNNKDSLVAAFIFHEAISKPPLSSRRRRTSLHRHS